MNIPMNVTMHMNKTMGMNTIIINRWNGRTLHHTPGHDRIQDQHRLYKRPLAATDTQ